MNEQEIRSLCEAADLPLDEERRSLVAPQLSAWLEAANDLSRTLAAPEHQTVLPITAFHHPVQEGGDE